MREHTLTTRERRNAPWLPEGDVLIVGSCSCGHQMELRTTPRYVTDARALVEQRHRAHAQTGGEGGGKTGTEERS